MNLLRERAGGGRRLAVSGAAFGTAVALTFGGLAVTPAMAAPGGTATGTGTNHSSLSPTLTVAPGQSLNPAGDSLLQLTGTGYATVSDFNTNFGGAYLLFGVVTPSDPNDSGSWAPSAGGVGGVNYDYAPVAGVYQSQVNYPIGGTEAGLGTMDANGNWTSSFLIPGATFTGQYGRQINCLVDQCGVITFGAHGQLSSGVEVFTPVTFAAENWEATAPSITAQPASLTVSPGADATFSVTATGDPAPTYQWQGRANAEGEWAPLAGETAASLTLPAVTAEDSGRQVRVVVANEADTVVSTEATLTVESPAEPGAPSVGVPYAGNTSYMVVTPGEELDADGNTVVTVEGHGYDSTGNIYVGLGFMTDPEEPEAWRRSAGGTSGPAGVADYTYGAPRFVAAYDAEQPAADALMTADGSWSYTMTIPGSDITSFFGGSFDCLVTGCGFFSFGAHGATNAANESYVPIYFEGQSAPVVPATETSTVVDAQASVSYPVDFAGEDVTVSAAVSPAGAAGSVEFFAGESSLGSADVVEGAAELVTDLFTGGAHQVKAVFTPADAALYEASESAERTFRIVDLTPAVSGIEAGTAVKHITDAELSWSIANFVSFGSGPGKEILDGDVVLSELPAEATATDRANREFIFSNGTGVEDAAGNRVISFNGEVRLTSGSTPQWNFRDPVLHANAAGDGYITAIVDGYYNDELYGPVRVTVSTFTGAATGTEDGVSSFTVAPIFEGQVAAGTWAGEYTGATFANEFLQYVNSGVRSFFFQSGTTGSNLTKPGNPINLEYVAGNAPTLTGQPQAATVVEGESATFTAGVSGTPAPSIQWQTRASVDAEWIDIAGATGVQLQLTEVGLGAHGSQYRFVAENAFGSIESDAASLSVRPAGEPTAPELTDENQGGFEVISIDGHEVTVNLGADRGNQWIGVSVHSDPEFLGWFLTAANGDLTVTVPAEYTGDHHLSFVDSEGALLGWVAVSFTEDSGTGGGTGGGDTTTGGTGTSNTGSGALSTTGASSAPLLVGGIALMLLVSGGVLLAAHRRRTAAE